MLALISHARIKDSGGHLRPFLQVQIQVWMRELRRVMAKVDGQQSELMLESDLNQKIADQARYLPVVNCHDCGATGWAGVEDESGRVIIRDLGAFYNQYFSADKHIRMIFPARRRTSTTLRSISRTAIVRIVRMYSWIRALENVPSAAKAQFRCGISCQNQNTKITSAPSAAENTA